MDALEADEYSDDAGYNDALKVFQKRFIKCKLRASKRIRLA